MAEATSAVRCAVVRSLGRWTESRNGQVSRGLSPWHAAMLLALAGVLTIATLAAFERLDVH